MIFNTLGFLPQLNHCPVVMLSIFCSIQIPLWKPLPFHGESAKLGVPPADGFGEPAAVEDGDSDGRRSLRKMLDLQMMT